MPVLTYGLAGENLARGSTGGEDITARIEQALMTSPAHRKNILETRYRRASIGAATDASGRIAFAEISAATEARQAADVAPAPVSSTAIL